jgi:hypothetical protein
MSEMRLLEQVGKIVITQYIERLLIAMQFASQVTIKMGN